jgi:hypothetical protein
MITDLDTRLGADWRALQNTAAGSPQRIIEIAAPDRASRRAILVELEDIRWSCRDLERHVGETGQADTLATSRWTVRQVVAHLASWARRTRLELESLTEGRHQLETIHFEPIGDGGPRTWNQREVEARRASTMATVFDEIESELTQVAEMVARLPEDQLRGIVELPRTSGEPAEPWRRSIAAMVLMSCRHTRYHLTRLERLAGRT